MRSRLITLSAFQCTVLAPTKPANLSQADLPMRILQGEKAGTLKRTESGTAIHKYASDGTSTFDSMTDFVKCLSVLVRQV